MLRARPLLLAAFLSSSAYAGDKIDPAVERVIRTGIHGAMQRQRPVPGRAKVLVELRDIVDDAAIARLEHEGVVVSRAEGVPLHYGRFVVATVDAAATERLAEMPQIVRVSSAGARGPVPLDMSATRIRLADARGARPSVGDLTGAGVTIADSDTAVDPFEPPFFKGDAGYFAWIDTDGDGVLTPGVDAIDLDRNGVADEGETATLLIAGTRDFYGNSIDARTSKTFDPGVDWLYLDTNGNGRRDHGGKGGFDDTTPAFGEPLFTPDDVNRNGTIDPGEKLVRLGTSKFKAVRALLGNPWNVDKTFTRGSNLSATVTNFTDGELYGFADSVHATGVSTILAGDLPLVGRRWVGMAPDADLLVAFDASDTLPLEGVMWMLMQSPDVALYELAPWTGFALDGSDPLSTLLDASSSNVVHTCPTGDQGSAGKHAHVPVGASSTTQLPFDLPAHAKQGTRALSYVDVSVNVRGGTPTTVTLTGPKGDSYDLTSKLQAPILDGAKIYATHEDSGRGTAFYDAILYVPVDSVGATLDVGTWTLKVGSTSNALTVDAYVSDDQSSWAVGAAWDSSVVSEASTLGVPSVADTCIAVNAQADHLDTGGHEPWYDMYYDVYDVPTGFEDADMTVRAYSPRGPRIDGVQKPDVVAPDNPWVAMSEDMGPYGSFCLFGGTSGASPHVTGVAALLVQAGTKGLPVRDAIDKGANHGSIAGLPNGDYGHGFLDAAGALGVTMSGGDFTISVAVDRAMPSVKHGKLVVTATGAAADTTGLEAKWDDGYDGSWDTSYSKANLSRTIPLAQPGTYLGKVRVRNAAGHVAEAVITTDVTKATGCGCNVGARAPSPSPFGALLVAGVWLFRRRRDRCPPTSQRL